ncbi:hypothetical protein GQ53DRAFT_875977 [Thozetella sp. PMI_491]|nr:hypothetical protein GQ53DRAFT_875977 [Thozetella sp. PMI_491]
MTPRRPWLIANQIQRTLLGSWINILLICCPVGFYLNYGRGKTVETFVVNFAASIPLSFMSELALEEMAKRLGKTLEQLLYLNIVLLVSCILLLVNGQSDVVQVTLAGSILANLLFVLGLSITVGSFRRTEQFFNRYAARVSSNMLSLSATSLLIPTASRLLNQSTPEGLTKQSRGASLILIIVYFLYLWCQLRTHREVFRKESQKVPAKPFREELPDGRIAQGFVNPVGIMGHAIPAFHENERIARILQVPPAQEDDEIREEPKLHFLIAVTLFATTTILLYFCIDFVVNSIDALTAEAGISKTFVGLILLPLPNCDFSPIFHALKDDMDVTVTYTIGKCLQTALLVTPMVVLLSWGMSVPDITLAFDGFGVVSLFAAILLLNFLIVEAKVSWIQGILLLADWALIALAAFFAT